MVIQCFLFFLLPHFLFQCYRFRCSIFPYSMLTVYLSYKCILYNSSFFETLTWNFIGEIEPIGFGVTFDGTNPTLSITSISMNGVNVCGGSTTPTTTAATTTTTTARSINKHCYFKSLSSKSEFYDHIFFQHL